MYSFMGGGLFCAIVGNILLVVSTATDYWMQYRLSGSFAHQGLWRYCMSGKCYMQTDSIAYWNATRAFMILSAMSCFAGIIAGILSFAHFSAFERFNRSFAAGIMFFVSTLFVLLAMAIYTGVTVNFLGKRFGDWRFSWSYILGWVSLLMTFFAGQQCGDRHAMTMPGFIVLTLGKSDSERHNFHTWIGHHRVQILIPFENLWDVLEKALLSGHTLPSSILDLGEKLMQH
uniref:Lens fiber membrane intrinsic protein n=1 Tax=Neogobius melanostomus TaxID=47308 RepID=A0A8C6SWR9_9GOBI